MIIFPWNRPIGPLIEPGWLYYHAYDFRKGSRPAHCRHCGLGLVLPNDRYGFWCGRCDIGSIPKLAETESV